MANFEYMLVTDIKLHPNNPRIIRDHKFKTLVKSIKDFPEMLELRPIVVNKDNVILGGNMRYKASIEAKLKKIPVIVANLTPEQEQEFVIKDNISFGEWDWDALANEWEQTELVEWGIDSFNFGTSADAITFDNEEELNDLNSPEAPAGSQAPATPKITDTGFVRFELVLLEEHKKIVLDVLNLIQDKQEGSLGEALHEMAQSYLRNN
jgi:hypothetical protein